MGFMEFNKDRILVVQDNPIENGTGGWKEY